MSCLFWNCRGLGVPLIVLALRDMIRAKNPDMVFLSETKRVKVKIEPLKRKWRMNGVSVDRVGQGGGLALLWRKEVTMDLLSFSPHHIDTMAQLSDQNLKWRLTGFYGWAEQNYRHKSWALLRTLANQSDLPWVIGGDFNKILSNGEKECGLVRSRFLTEAFRMALLDYELSKVVFVGNPFTWSNHRKASNTIRCRLDRVCVNSGWSSPFFDSPVEHLSYPGFDHIPIIFHVKRSVVEVGGNHRRPFRFEARWMRRAECEDIIRESWELGDGTDSFDRLFQGVEACQLGLRQLTRDASNNPRKQIAKLREQIQLLDQGELMETSRVLLASLRADGALVHG